MKLRHSTLLARRSGSRGMTMIEVLVTLVIVSFGLLGVGALQLMSLQVNQGANQRSQASMLALSALDAMRGNRANAPNYARSYGAAAPSYTATNIHDQDLAAIVNQVQRALPAGDIRIRVNAINGTQTFYDVIVNVRWNENDRLVDQNSTATAAPTELTLQARI